MTGIDPIFSVLRMLLCGKGERLVEDCHLLSE